MEDIGEKISDLLNSPDGLERLKTLAEGLFSSTPSGDNKSLPSEETNGLTLPNNLLQNVENIGGIMRIINILGKEQKDSRIDLLNALKPHLSSERAKRVDKAISILKIATLLPILREEGLLDSLGF